MKALQYEHYLSGDNGTVEFVVDFVDARKSEYADIAGI